MTPEQMKRVREITDQFALDTPILYEDVGAAILAALADSLLNEPCTDAKEMGHGCYRAVKAENELAAAIAQRDKAMGEADAMEEFLGAAAIREMKVEK